MSLTFYKCPKGDCDGSSFRFDDIELQNATYLYWGVKCTKCNALVAVLNRPVESWIQAIKKKLGV